MKPFWRSKTVIFNVLSILVLVAQQFGFLDFKLEPGVETGVVAIINLALRFVTRAAVVIR